MTFDLNTHLAATGRSMRLTTRDGGSAYAVAISRSYAAAAEDLWDAVTNGERIPRWFLPVSGDLEVGGRYQLERNAGGMVTACEAPSRFSLTWEFGDDLSWVDVEVVADGAGRARLTLTHSSRPSDHWDRFGPGATGVGWEMGLVGLAIHLSDPQAALPEDATFTDTEEGKAFVRGCSAAWGEAAIAAGSDPDAACAAARRTAAFYTGEPL